MTNLENISYYEKLHDIFERVPPDNFPMQIEKLIKYLEEGSKAFEQVSGDLIDNKDVIGILEEMKYAFTDALRKNTRSFMLTNEERGYKVNIYPIKNFLMDNTGVIGELSNLKMRMVKLLNGQNIGLFKQNYEFLDSLTIVLEE